MRLLLLLHLLLFVTTSAQREPLCANGQLPKLDKNGHHIQCLPGWSSRSVCGINHTCYFSGMNYMCCPSNEPSHDNQPACPSPTLTVLDSHGLPLKCNPRSRVCPQEKMICMDVGLAYICCEGVQRETIHSNTVVAHERKRVPQRKNSRRMGAEESLNCPQNSIDLLNADGSQVLCNPKSKCPGRNTFCHGALKRSICCERYEMAANTLDTMEGTATANTAQLPIKIQSIRPPQMDGMKLNARENRIDSSASLASASKTASKKKTVKIPLTSTTLFPQQTSSISRSNGDTSETAHVGSVSRPTSSSPSPTLPETTTTEAQTSNSIVVAHGIQTFQDRKHLSNVLPSQLFSRQDKRTMTQHFLMHQIRNGWPYDDRFYRPDVDAFSPEQRRDMAHMQFSDS